MFNHPNYPRHKKQTIERLAARTGVDMRQAMANENVGWRERVSRASQRACTPLKFAMAIGDDMPLPLEVVRNDSQNVVVHIFRRPDIPMDKAENVVAQAIADVFGPPRESMREKSGELMNVFYRDEEAIRLAEGLNTKVLPTDSWYIEFPGSMSAVLPSVDHLRDRLAAAVKARWTS